MQNFYIKGYYGYKNLGDEFLLLGLLLWLAKQAEVNDIIIETKNTERLNLRLDTNKHLLPPVKGVIQAVPARNTYKKNPSYLKIFGGGEVVSDARPFPYNGWNYLLLFAEDIVKGNFWIVGGIGTEKKTGTKRLYRRLLTRAARIVVREETSFELAKKYNQHVELYHDFALDLLDVTWEKHPSSGRKKTLKTEENISTNVLVSHFDTTPSLDSPDPLLITSPSARRHLAWMESPPAGASRILINVNKYIRNESTQRRIEKLHATFPHATYRFFPAEIGSDDLLYPQIQKMIPTIQIYNRTEHSLEEIGEFIQTFDFGLAARLHILLLLRYFTVPFFALVYQEKIVKMLGDGTGA